VVNEDETLQRMSSVTDEKRTLFDCLKEIQLHHVLAGSSVAYAKFSKISTRTIEIFVLQKYKPFHVIEVISKHFFNFTLSFEIEEKDYSILNVKVNLSKFLPSLLQSGYAEDVVFQIIQTNCTGAREVLSRLPYFALDCFTCAIYKDSFYEDPTTVESWERKTILECRIENLQPSSYDAIHLQFSCQRFFFNYPTKPVSWKRNVTGIFEKCSPDNRSILKPMLKGVLTKSAKMNFEIVDVCALEDMSIDYYGNCIQKAEFFLKNSDGVCLTVESLVAGSASERYVQVSPRIDKKCPSCSVVYITSNLISEEERVFYLPFALPKISFEIPENHIVDTYLTLLKKSATTQKEEQIYDDFRSLYFVDNLSFSQTLEMLCASHHLRKDAYDISTMQDFVNFLRSLS